MEWFYLIDDKHIVINNESPFRLLSIHRATFQSIFAIFRLLFSFFTLAWVPFRSKNLIKLKWKSICFASEKSADGFDWTSLFVFVLPPFTHFSHRYPIIYYAHYVSMSLVKPRQLSLSPLMTASILIWRIRVSLDFTEFIRNASEGCTVIFVRALASTPSLDACQ